MRITKKKLRKSLSEKVVKKLEIIGEMCVRSGYRCYLVGGTVRDMILKVPQIDIDIVTEGDITSLVSNIAKRWKLKKTIRSQFSTVKISFVHNILLDIAQARKETYPYPASLPVVQKGNIVDDLKRRDFTINTLLMGISKKNFGIIYDYLGGIEDIEKKTIRVLHKNSFIDDPTRIFRAFRFKERFSFRFERKTKKLINNAVRCGLIKKLSPQRIRKEFFLLLEERNWDKIILNLSKEGVFKELGIRNNISRATINSFRNIISNFNTTKRNWKLSKLLIITENAKPEEIKTFSQRVGLKKKESNLLLELTKKKTSLTLSKKEISTKQIYLLLETIPLDGLVYLLSKVKPRSKKRIMMYLNNLKDIKTKINGKDLKRLGIKEGPIYKQILKMVFDEKLDGRLKTKKEEIEFVKQIIRRKRV
jgi:tRNA nucleotidyltransferase (CCA-adding enzyme)